MYYSSPYWNSAYFRTPYWNGTSGYVPPKKDDEIKIKQTGRWMKQRVMDRDIIEILAALLETKIL